MSLNKVIVIIDAGLVRHISNNAKNDYCSTFVISTDINNVGLGISRSIFDLTDDDIDIMIRFNVKTALYGIQIVIPYFRQQGYGHLINISSILGQISYTTFRSMYSASKAALNSLITNLRMELQIDPCCEKIHVTTILPGMVKTNFAMNVIGDSAPKSLIDYKIPFIRPFPRTSQSIDDVWKIICNVINDENQPREVYTNPEHEPLIKQYFENVGNFEILLKPST
ncbi:unnamed protein product [Rotaria sp. Silwood1]|nr:unnamed protein product [Rotaria sp. Silwood1]